MSGLARLLARHTPPGVYRWASATAPTDVEHAVAHAGWRYVGLDTWQVADKGQFLDACKQSFDFPHWVGRNFDALADALSDIRAPDGEGVIVLWDGWGPLAREHPRVFEVAVSVFASRVDFERAGAFAVLLHGPGPSSVELPELDPRDP